MVQNQDFVYIFACSVSRSSLEEWADTTRTKCQGKGIEYRGPTPHPKKRINGVVYFIRTFRLSMSSQVKEIIGQEPPEDVYVEISVGTKFDISIEDIVPDEKLEEYSAIYNYSKEEGIKEGIPRSSSKSSENDFHTGEDQSGDDKVNRSVESSVVSSQKTDDGLMHLRRKAKEAAVEVVPNSEIVQKSPQKEYSRSTEVRDYVKARADGICEGCGEEAPFISKTGEPYLHAHHIHELSNGGSDTIHTVIALCPNCHYRVHHGKDGDEYNEVLLDKLKRIEDVEERPQDTFE